MRRLRGLLWQRGCPPALWSRFLVRRRHHPRPGPL